MTIPHASIGRNFWTLKEYLIKGTENEPRQAEHITRIETRNLPEGTDPDGASRAMFSEWVYAQEKKGNRCGKPVFHFSISLEKDEDRGDDFLVQLADEALAHKAMDHRSRPSKAKGEPKTLWQASEHQALFVIHRDTANPHIHVMMNKIHPTNSKTYRDAKMHLRLRRACTDLEKKHGLRVVTHSRDEQSRELDIGGDPQPPRGETMMNRRRAKEGQAQTPPRWPRSRLNELRKALGPEFKEATSWDDLEGRLRGHGVAIFPKGKGWSISDGQNHAKISDMGKAVRIPRLEKRFQKGFDRHMQERQPPEDWLAERIAENEREYEDERDRDY